MSKRPSSEAGPSSGQDTSKRSRPDLSPPRPQSLHAWLHPDLPPPLMTNSPPLHDSTSTFLSFSISFMPPAHITSEAALAKEARRMVRDLNVVSHVSDAVTEAGDGAFQDGEGMVTSNKGKQRAREPDHRMWAIRTLCLKEGKDGTKGDDDYQLLETYNDDGEKFGGERVLRILKDERGVDVLTICCRWYGGDMLGPIRFQHIGLTAKTSLNALQKLSTLRDLRQGLEALDDEIQSLRDTINPPGSPILSIDPKQNGKGGSEGKYDEIDDILRLERLVKARENTKKALEGKVGWAAMERARVEEDTGSAR